ncbi:copper transporter [Actinoalloteichus caeruleus]|uniref:Copper transport outer membrane protein, MctB n=3 Tax=Actinoalloteichus cyanogriseus TaxID=2893586 RepID=A0ABT1JHB5_ACTCY|nr:copper transporter [Actinoalloteichus caeruleus]MCP2331573.1 Copper transport outer membrane protein, MctB [Actinoalloteichus caeruleus DSM 43889]
MSPSRYRMLTATSVLLALAAGVVVGAGASGMRASGAPSSGAELAERVAELEAERAELRERLGGAEEFGASVGPLVVRDVLAGRSVLLVTTGDVEDAEASSVAALVEAAGGRVAGGVGMTEDLVDGRRADQLRELARRLLPAGASLPAGGDPGSLAGALLASLLVVDPVTGEPRSEEVEREVALTALAEAGFLRASEPVPPAELVLVLTGAGVGTAAGDVTGGTVRERSQLLRAVVSELARVGRGVVVAGPPASADADGLVGVVRTDAGTRTRVSTVDTLGGGEGSAVAVLALRAAWEGEVGHFGGAGNAGRRSPLAPGT